METTCITSITAASLDDNEKQCSKCQFTMKTRNGKARKRFKEHEMKCTASFKIQKCNEDQKVPDTTNDEGSNSSPRLID